MLGTAYALTQHSLTLMYLFYGVIGGIGLGTGYITPVSTLVKWFPNNRGLATGLAIMGFGFASLIAGPVMQLLIASYGFVANFVILGCVYFLVMTTSALYLEPPKMLPLVNEKIKYLLSLFNKNILNNLRFKKRCILGVFMLYGGFSLLILHAGLVC